MTDFWTEMGAPGPDSATVDGVELRRGSRVRLRPRAGGDPLAAVMDGRIGVVEGIDQDDEGRIHVAVALEDDPGRDLGAGRFPGHRFFFAAEEVEPLAGAAERSPPRVLVAGIGNIFLGDDGFGVAVARRLAERPPRPGVDAVDFGIRGMDLVYALQRGYDAALLVDAVPTGDAPGTLCVLEPGPETFEAAGGPQAHAMDPVSVLRLARTMGAVPPRILVVGCAPARVPDAAADEVLVALSAPVAAAVDGAVRLIDSLLDELVGSTAGAPVDSPPEAPAAAGGRTARPAGPTHPTEEEVSP